MFEDLFLADGRLRPGVQLAVAIARRMLPPFSYADLFLTEACNHRCDYCFVKDKNQFRHMTPEVACQAVDFMVAASKDVKQVRFLFFGGEPLLCFEVMQAMVDYARRQEEATAKEFGFDMTTNGTLLTEERMRWLAQKGIKYLLSLDGTKEVHDRHRKMLGGGSSFDRVMELLPQMKRYQPWQGVRMTVHPDEAEHLSASVAELFRRGINQFIIGPATGLEWPPERLAVYEEQMKRVADFYREAQARKWPFRMTLFEQDMDCPSGKYKGVWGCGAGRGRVCISVTGELYGCAKILGVDALRETHKIGDIWRGVYGLRTRCDLLNVHPSVRPQCVACEHADDCTGGCPATHYEATGSVFKPSPLDCAFVPIFKRIKAYLHRNGSENQAA
jgi:uncharacterized protein